MVAVEYLRGSAAELHDLDPAAGVAGGVVVRVCEVTQPALVLGSRQRSGEIVDRERCAELGIDVVVRRSGGGAVLLIPGSMIWFDLWIPATDHRFEADVRRSMVAVGGWWRAALERVDASLIGRLSVHDGPEVSSPWSDAICFAGIGPGEVLLDGRKLVGVSQRRNAAGARVQTMAHRRNDLAPMESLLASGALAAGGAPWPTASIAIIESGDSGDGGLAERLLDALVDQIDHAGS